MRIRALLFKEWEEGAKNRLLVLSVFLPPILLALLPLMALSGIPVNVPTNPDLMHQLGSMGLGRGEITFTLIASQFLFLYLLIPAIVPLTVASFSVIGEKQGKTLEPLLATPVSTVEILVGKCLAAIIPAVLVSWLAYGILLAETHFMIGAEVARMFLIKPVWIVTMGILAPVLSIFSVILGIMVSSRANDPRTAQQISVVVVVPIIALMAGSAANVISVGPLAVAIASAVLMAADVVLITLAARLFGRETILTRWK